MLCSCTKNMFENYLETCRSLLPTNDMGTYVFACKIKCRSKILQVYEMQTLLIPSEQHTLNMNIMFSHTNPEWSLNNIILFKSCSFCYSPANAHII